MEILTIDLGSYSLKFLEGEVDRDTIRYSKYHEELLLEHLPEDFSESQATDELSEDDESKKSHWEVIEDTQIEIISSYLLKNNHIERVYINIPPELLTTRFLTIPIKNRKKVEQMLPFQLDEELPFNTHEAHFASHQIPLKTSTYAITSITQKTYFNRFYNKLKTLPIMPHAIIPEESIFQGMLLDSSIEDSIAILNIGHSVTKCYFFKNKILVGTQISYIGGKIIDEMIAENYQISIEEAILFKHQNSFLLTDKQMDSANENQKEFAKLMNAILKPLIRDFNRWKLSYRLKSGNPIDKIFITGGTTNIKNIENFLTQQLEIPISHLDLLRSTSLSTLDLEEIDMNQLHPAHGLTLHSVIKKGLSNFRNGEYAAPSDSGLPLHAISFIGMRMALVTALIIITLVTENMVLKKQDLSLRKNIAPILKKTELRITNAERVAVHKRPERVLNTIRRRNKEVEQEISVIQSTAKINALDPLAEMSRIIDENQEVDLLSFKNTNDRVEVVFSAQEVQSLKTVRNIIQGKGYSNLEVTLLEKEKKMNLFFDVE